MSCTCRTRHLPTIHYKCKCSDVVEEVIDDIYLTTVELNDLRSQVENLLASHDDWFNIKRFGILSNSRSYRGDLLLIIVFLQYWTQYTDGTTTGLYNYASREEFSKVISKARDVVGTTIIQ